MGQDVLNFWVINPSICLNLIFWVRVRTVCNTSLQNIFFFLRKTHIGVLFFQSPTGSQKLHEPLTQEWEKWNLIMSPICCCLYKRCTMNEGSRMCRSDVKVWGKERLPSSHFLWFNKQQKVLTCCSNLVYIINLCIPRKQDVSKGHTSGAFKWSLGGR